MGFFGNLFEKKTCSICDGEIGLLGNRKLEDGNLCKNCARQLSPWFSDRRHSTVEEIRQQLAYREENRKKAAQFSVSRSLGNDWKVLLDESHRWLTVTRARNLAEENPDILDFSAVTGCRLDIDDSRTELKRTDKDGNRVSYNPPRYEHSYNFEIIISVANPYFDEMNFRLNSGSVDVIQGVSSGVSGSFGRLLDTVAGSGYDPMNDAQYRQYYELGQEICEELRRIRETAGAAPAAAPAAQVPAEWTCPACGGSNQGKFCEFCGAARPQ